MEDFSLLIGKTILSAKVRKSSKYDDEGFLDLEFSDGSKCTIEGSYGGYTGKSADEYISLIHLREFGFDYS